MTDFETRTEPGKWPSLSRAQIAADLRDRIDNFNNIDQKNTSLCGAASFFRELVSDDPDKFAQTAIDLYEKGTATIGSLTLKPKSDLMNYKLDSKDIAQGDWILTSSLRDSGNWFIDYQSVGDDVAAITIPSTLAGWFSAAGYLDVKNDTNLLVCKDWDNAKSANHLMNLGYHVCLFISSNMLLSPTQPSVIPNHWIVLLEPIEKVNVDACQFHCYSWGDEHRVPETGYLRIKHFEWNYYGYVACKH